MSAMVTSSACSTARDGSNTHRYNGQSAFLRPDQRIGVRRPGLAYTVSAKKPGAANDHVSRFVAADLAAHPYVPHYPACRLAAVRRGAAGKLIRRSSTLKASERHILLTLLERADNATCVIPLMYSPSLSRIQRETHLARSTVAAGLAHLEQHRWIERRVRERGQVGGVGGAAFGRGRVEYRLIPDDVPEECDCPKKIVRPPDHLEAAQSAPESAAIGLSDGPIGIPEDGTSPAETSVLDERAAVKGEVAVGEPSEAEELTVTIAGRVHPAEVCKGCGDLVPSAFAYDGRHMWCGDQKSPFDPSIASPEDIADWLEQTEVGR